MTSSEKKNIDPRKLQDLYNAFDNADYIVRKRYRSDLEKYPICPLPDWLLTAIPSRDSVNNAQEVSDTVLNLGDNVQFFKVEKLVYDKAESVTDKLTNVYHAMTAFEDTSVIMILSSDGSEVEIYLGIAERHLGRKNLPAARGNKLGTLKASFESNFIGSTIRTQFEDTVDGKTKRLPIDNEKLIKKVFGKVESVSSVTGVASFRSKNAQKNENSVQGLEKLIEAMHGKPFSAVFIADCKGNNEIEKLCADYEDLYSKLSPFSQSQQTIGKTDGVTDTESFVDGVTETTNNSVSNSISHSHTLGKSSSNSVGVSAGGQLKLKLGVNYNHTWGKSESDTESEAKITTSGTSQSLTKQNSTAKAISNSTNEGLQITFQNRAVKTLLDRIDEQIKHLRSCEAFGVFDFGCYFLSRENATTRAAASIYDSLMRGEDSFAEVSSVNSWTDQAAKLATEYLMRFYHPLIAIPNLSKPDDQDPTLYESLIVTPTTIISGREISLHMGLPKKSVNGIPVIDCAEFGRNVISTDGNKITGVRLGSVYHMQKTENTPVKLDADSLTMHTFITGSTGSGKSNTVYKLLSQMKALKANFLVIEPAKGEYKNVFGQVAGVTVFGTNPKYGKLLRINPFSFPEEIHVYEHMDRLIEIFNVCWPMYAAMPAVLKDAVERAYIDAGWDLRTSTNKYNSRLFPTFIDVLNQIEAVMNESQYSADSKGDYKGALSTRIRSLTNGINGLIFSSDERSEDELFEANVIVDLSRVGSTETKSLIMGLLLVKLQEHRMSHSSMNSHLKHITVLEEAHNLLKRTSTEQSNEGANLAGKSVEMLTNAIAEMRTYGEGFIIADQAPGLLDMAVIRNTNTKIILRLPEQSDRELVGRAAGLNEDQIAELAKLGKGIAAVYQNDWIEAVLCNVDEYREYDKKYIHNQPQEELHIDKVRDALISRFVSKDIYRLIDQVDVEILKSNIPARAKCMLYEYVATPPEDRYEIAAAVAYELFNCRAIIPAAVGKLSFDEQRRYLTEKLQHELSSLTDDQIHILLCLVVFWFAHETENPDAMIMAQELFRSEKSRRIE